MTFWTSTIVGVFLSKHLKSINHLLILSNLSMFSGIYLICQRYLKQLSPANQTRVLC